MDNILLFTDSYKASHWLQYPKGATNVSSYIESRGGRWNRVVFFGLQMFIKKYLINPFTKEMIDEAEEFWQMHGLPFNREGWEYILKEYNGFLPIEIEAIPEGTVIGTSNALVQVVNTDDKCCWLTSYIETALLQAVWYPTTVCTQSYMIKQLIKNALIESSDIPDLELPFKLHDFGFRGVSSYESAGIGGAAHLVNFMGSDTVAGVLYARKYYDEPMAGFSIPASEHSTITSWGKDNEINAFDNMIEQFAGVNLNGSPKIYACVSDSYDIWAAVDKWKSLESKIKDRGGVLVVRPDSGNPVAVTSGLISELMYAFGYTINSKGYKVLPDYIRVIQGDGINENTIRDILRELQFRKISASNIAFGMGGALLQHLDRDALRFAMKASAIKINNDWNDVFKDPITDSNKKSKKGILSVYKSDTLGFVTARRDVIPDNPERGGCINLLQPVFRNGELLKSWTFAEVRKNTEE